MSHNMTNGMQIGHNFSSANNCSFNATSTLSVTDSIESNVSKVSQTPTNSKDSFLGDDESKRIITESHQNPWQTAFVYISIILSVYFLTILFFAIRYALNRYYEFPLECCCPPKCCSSCKQSANQDFITISPTSSSRAGTSSSRAGASHNRTLNSSFLPAGDPNTIEVTQTDEGFLETDL